LYTSLIRASTIATLTITAPHKDTKIHDLALRCRARSSLSSVSAKNLVANKHEFEARLIEEIDLIRAHGFVLGGSLTGA
jgi:hypothetical protein